MALVLPSTTRRPTHPLGNPQLFASQRRVPADTTGTRLWLPSDLGSKLQTWLRGDDLTGANGSSVTTWTDATANANNATGATAKPSLVTAGLNGMNTVAFDGISQYFTLPTGLLTGRTQSASFAVYNLVASPPPVSNQVGPVFGDFGTESTTGNHDPYSDGNFYEDYCSTTRRTVTTVPASTLFRIFGLRSKAADWRLDINGTNYFTDGTNTFGGNSAPCIGSTRVPSAYYLQGQIAEIVDCNDFLTTSEKEQVEGYLAWKWGLEGYLPIGHAYAAAAPRIALTTGTVFTQAISVSATPIPTQQLSTGKTLSVSSTLAPTLVRLIGKAISVTATPLPSVVRLVSHVLSIALIPVPAILRSAGKVVSIAPASVPALAAAIRHGVIIAISSIPVPALVRATAHRLSVASTSVPALTRQTAKRATISSTPTPTFNALKAVGVNLSILTTPVPSARRLIVKAANVNTVPPPSLVKALARLLSISAAPMPGVARATARAVGVTATPVPTTALARRYARLLAVSASPSPSLGRAVAKALAVAAGPVGSVVRSLGRLLSVSAAPIPNVAEQLHHQIEHPDVTTPAERTTVGAEADRTASGSITDRTAAGNLQPRRAAA